MNFFRVGVVDFFGILCPGVLLLVNILVFLFACGAGGFNLSVAGGFNLSLLLFVICYLFGFILRLISPDYVDKAATHFKKLKAFKRYRKERNKLLVEFKNEGGITEMLYLFSWENVSGSDSVEILKLLGDKFDINWAGNAEIHKVDDKTICISKNENSAEIRIDEKKEKATLKISDGKTHKLKVKKEDGKLNIYKKLNRKERKEQIKALLEDYYDELIKNGDKLPYFFWIDDIYPYYFSHKFRYYKSFPPKVAHAIMGKKDFHNKDTYNFWKTLLISHDPNLATQVFQEEAFVRFMSGSFWALFIGILTGIALVIMHNEETIKIGVCLMTISILMVSIILNGFKNQRRREVKVLLDAIFITSKASYVHDPLGQEYFE
ncbi:hypothetical protein C5S31_09270 [ANME-1 cluster archaeon GoMg2]|nr:hypothetical protein [ANME-1 cluster archaeon GoMg2]